MKNQQTFVIVALILWKIAIFSKSFAWGRWSFVSAAGSEFKVNFLFWKITRESIKNYVSSPFCCLSLSLRCWICVFCLFLAACLAWWRKIKVAGANGTAHNARKVEDSVFSSLISSTPTSPPSSHNKLNDPAVYFGRSRASSSLFFSRQLRVENLLNWTLSTRRWRFPQSAFVHTVDGRWHERAAWKPLKSMMCERFKQYENNFGRMTTDRPSVFAKSSTGNCSWSEIDRDEIAWGKPEPALNSSQLSMILPIGKPANRSAVCWSEFSIDCEKICWISHRSTFLSTWERDSHLLKLLPGSRYGIQSN